MSEIKKARQILREAGFYHRYDLMVLHSQVDTSALHSLLNSHDGKRRIFLSTNIAETSLTIPGVTTVIDSGLVRIRCHRGGRSGLILSPVCEDSMAQRAGRAGRLKEGKCIRLWSQTFKGEAITPPQIERTELLDMTLAALGAGLSVDEMTVLPWVTAPPEFALNKSVDILKTMNAVNDYGHITPHGRAINALPLPVELARLLVKVPSRLSGTIADIVALISTNNSFLLPLVTMSPEKRSETEEARKELFDEAFDEVTGKLLCLRKGDVRKHSLSFSTLRMARLCSRELRRFVGDSIDTPSEDTSSLPENDDIASFIIDRWPESAFVLRKRARHKRAQYRGKDTILPLSPEPWSNDEIELFCRPYSRWSSCFFFRGEKESSCCCCHHGP